MQLDDSSLQTQKSSMSDSSLYTNHFDFKSTRRMSSGTTKTTSSNRQRLSPIDNNFLTQRASSSSFSVPILITAMNNFFQSISHMEEEIMLPLRLKDISVQELIFDNSSVQPDTWHEVYSFLLDMRNQLLCACPFADEQRKVQERQCSIDDEGIMITSNDSMHFSSASSTVSSEEFEQNPSSSNTIRDELRFHYYGLFRSLEQLIGLTHRVIEKYQEECVY